MGSKYAVAKNKPFQTATNSRVFFVDHPHLNKTEVENIGQERTYETIKYTSSLSNVTDTPETLPEGNDHVYPYSYVTEKSLKGKEDKQPCSYIQEPYIDLTDINKVSVRQYRGKVENYFSFSCLS